MLKRPSNTKALTRGIDTVQSKTGNLKPETAHTNTLDGRSIGHFVWTLFWSINRQWNCGDKLIRCKKRGRANVLDTYKVFLVAIQKSPASAENDNNNRTITSQKLVGGDNFSILPGFIPLAPIFGSISEAKQGFEVS